MKPFQNTIDHRSLSFYLHSLPLYRHSCAGRNLASIKKEIPAFAGMKNVEAGMTVMEARMMVSK